MLSFYVTQANVDDREVLKHNTFLKKILQKTFWDGIHLITGIRRSK